MSGENQRRESPVGSFFRRGIAVLKNFEVGQADPGKKWPPAESQIAVVARARAGPVPHKEMIVGSWTYNVN